MAGRHRRRRKTIAVLALAILVLVAGGLIFAQMRVQAASLDDFNWLHDAPAATTALPGQGA